MVQGPLFTDIKPKAVISGVNSYRGALLTPNYLGLDDPGGGVRQLVLETFDQYRIGQTIFFEFEVFLDVPGTISAIRLRPWWLRPQQEFRAVGPGVTATEYIVGPTGTEGVDFFAFGSPSAFGLAATDRVWQSDQQQEQQIAPTFPAVPVGKVFANLVDNVWRLPIDSALVADGYSFTKAFHWPAHGYALAFTSELEGIAGAGAPGQITSPVVRISWKTGATHSITQENVE